MSGIKEYTQDMHNPTGLSQAQDGLPLASAAMAQDGCKVGEGLLEGIRNGQKRVVAEVDRISVADYTPSDRYGGGFRQESWQEQS